MFLLLNVWLKKGTVLRGKSCFFYDESFEVRSQALQTKFIFVGLTIYESKPGLNFSEKSHNFAKKIIRSVKQTYFEELRKRVPKPRSVMPLQPIPSFNPYRQNETPQGHNKVVPHNVVPCLPIAGHSLLSRTNWSFKWASHQTIIYLPSVAPPSRRPANLTLLPADSLCNH